MLYSETQLGDQMEICAAKCIANHLHQPSKTIKTLLHQFHFTVKPSWDIIKVKFVQLQLTSLGSISVEESSENG